MKFNLDYDHLMSLRLMFDTAALVLIWLVQLVIYPAFLHFQNEDFKRWHLAYTRRVTYVVLPVMFGQLAVYGWLVLTVGGWSAWLNLALILAVWVITFLRAVQLHGLLDAEDDHLALSASLVTVNWWRTGLWTVVWVLTFFEVWRVI